MDRLLRGLIRIGYSRLASCRWSVIDAVEGPAAFEQVVEDDAEQAGDGDAFEMLAPDGLVRVPQGVDDPSVDDLEDVVLAAVPAGLRVKALPGAPLLKLTQLVLNLVRERGSAKDASTSDKQA